jgi:hypothetical protein
VLGEDAHSRVGGTARCIPDDNRYRPCSFVRSRRLRRSSSSLS